ncbi:MAG: hypothetical protein NTV73_00725 [Hyphomicrobiales bacterium]|nr:hypothetical protein [Hyphomicrobiales bacterium]
MSQSSRTALADFFPHMADGQRIDGLAPSNARLSNARLMILPTRIVGEPS